MSHEDLVEQILAAWRRHQEILVYLLEQIPDEGLAAKPTGSRGRDVARQFAHVNRVRLGWLHHHETGERPKLPRHDKGSPPPKGGLESAIQNCKQKGSEQGPVFVIKRTVDEDASSEAGIGGRHCG